MQEFAKKHSIKMKVAKNTAEFMSSIKMNSYNVLLCDLNLDYEHEGLTILQIYKLMLKNGSIPSGKIFSFTFDSIEKKTLTEKGFDGIIDKDFDSIDRFLKEYKVNCNPGKKIETKKKSLSFVPLS